MNNNRQTTTDLDNHRTTEQPDLIAPPAKPMPQLPAPPKTRRPRKSAGRRWLWLIVAAAAIAAGYFGWTKYKSMQSAKTAPPASTEKGRGRGAAISVVAAKAQRGNIGIYFTALGAVTPIYTVTVKSRVDGQLMQVLFKEGEIVQQGAPLLEIDPRPYQAVLDQAQGQLARDQALLKNAQIDLERYRVLVAQQAIPQQQFATQDALVAQYQGTIKADQAAIETANLNLVYCHITSPITGLVGLRLVDPGNIVHASDANGLLVITQLDPISVIFTLAEDQLPAVLSKMTAGQHLTVEAWDRDLKNKLVQGTLQTIDNQIDPTTGTLKLRATFENQNRKLFPSQFVNVRLLVEQKNGVTLVPSAAIQRNTQGAYVWLVNPNQTVTVRNITVGATEGEQSEITGGLKPGDAVVTIGVDKLQEGGKVDVEIPGKVSSNTAGKPASKNAAKQKS